MSKVGITKIKTECDLKNSWSPVIRKNKIQAADIIGEMKRDNFVKTYNVLIYFEIPNKPKKGK
jgi:hypothetical protein